MKKFLIFAVVMICFAVNAKAQTVLPVNIYIYSYTGIAADTVGTVGTLWTKTVQLNKLNGLFYNAKLKVQDVTAGAQCTVKLKGKVFANDIPTTITTYTWKGGGTDTTVVFTENTNKIYYRYLTFEVEQVANKLKVASIDLSLKK